MAEVQLVIYQTLPDGDHDPFLVSDDPELIATVKDFIVNRLKQSKRESRFAGCLDRVRGRIAQEEGESQ